MKKYYTPTIEEFHIGFEYEWLNENSDWVKEETPTEISINGFDEQVYGLRVKYLDKEDIESLGFKYEKTHAGTTESFYIKDTFDNIYDYIGLDYDTDINYLRIYFCNTEGDNTLFQGNIKNKSELIKVLKMIGINE